MMMIDYLKKMNGLTNSLATTGAPILDDDLITSTIAGLDMEYMSITTSLLRDENLKWTDVFESLFSYEDRMSQIQSL
ncbi:hypothetical protein Sjap_023880 [Stephania japonica]|uniref:Uncharacterized protein n=1 Tax=Stephania japonica TaxID=461633 RepID=A0AAP0HJD0_9MAGN